MIKLTDIFLNPNNPRVIKDWRFEKLCDNIRRFPKLLSLRPIVAESRKHPVILGGNMRYKALQAIGYEKIDPSWVKYADELTPEERQAFIILDNMDYGEWDYEALNIQWSFEQLADWGVEMPIFQEQEEEKEQDNAVSDAKPTYKLEIIFSDQEEQKKVHAYLADKGYRCKIINS